MPPPPEETRQEQIDRQEAPCSPTICGEGCAPASDVQPYPDEEAAMEELIRKHEAGELNDPPASDVKPQTKTIEAWSDEWLERYPGSLDCCRGKGGYHPMLGSCTHCGWSPERDSPASDVQESSQRIGEQHGETMAVLADAGVSDGFSPVYLAGPMSMHKEADWNHPHFNRIAKELRDRGYSVLNPAETDGGSTDKSQAFYLRQAFIMVTLCNSIAVLSGWRESSGATVEVHMARAIGVPVLNAYTMLPLSEDVI